MKATLAEYHLRLKQLLEYLGHIEKVIEIAQSNVDEISAKAIVSMYSLRTKKIYDYNFAIITLYGIFENFNEQIIQSYLRQLNTSIKEYPSLPTKVVENHIELSANLILSSTVQQKYSDIKREKVIENLNSCLNSKDHFALNIEAYTQHSANFRLDMLREFYGRVGIANIIQGIRKEPAFLAYQLKANARFEDDTKKASDGALFFELDDLVMRRNQIAHGYESDDLLDITIMQQYVGFAGALIESIYHVLNKIYHRHFFEKSDKVNLGNPIDVYNNEIVCIGSKGVALRNNGFLYACNPQTNELFFGKILSLEKDHCQIDSTVEGDNCNVGMKVDFKAKKAFEYFVLLP